MATLSPRLTSQESQTPSHNTLPSKPYDFLLKFLLVGDSDVGKEEILNGLANGVNDFPYGYSTSVFIFSSFKSKLNKIFLFFNTVFFSWNFVQNNNDLVRWKKN